METVAWFTVIIAALIIATLALGLVRVILHLIAVKQSLGSLLSAVEVVAERTSAVPMALPSVNKSLGPVREFCDSV